MRHSRVVLTIALPFALMACPDSDPVEPGTELIYAATLLPLNGSQVTGTAVFVVDEQEDVVILELAGSNLAPSITHLQHVHLRSECPTFADDDNADDWIDVVEGQPRFGRILIPLDSDLRTQEAGTYPTASASGQLQYSQGTRLSTMLADLRAPDPDPSDAVAKLDATTALAPHTRSIVIYGVAPGTQLPPSVAALPGTTPQQSLPVACGTFALVP